MQVFDFGNFSGNAYLIMELVRGLDLGRVISRDGPIPWARAAPLFVQICGALQEAHELGIVHAGGGSFGVAGEHGRADARR